MMAPAPPSPFQDIPPPPAPPGTSNNKVEAEVPETEYTYIDAPVDPPEYPLPEEPAAPPEDQPEDSILKYATEDLLYSFFAFSHTQATHPDAPPPPPGSP